METCLLKVTYDNMNNKTKCSSECELPRTCFNIAGLNITLETLNESYIKKSNDISMTQKTPTDPCQSLLDKNDVFSVQWEYISAGLVTFLVVLCATHFLLIYICPLKHDMTRNNSIDLQIENQDEFLNVEETSMTNQLNKHELEEMYAKINKNPNLEEMYATVDKLRVVEAEEIYANT